MSATPEGNDDHTFDFEGSPAEEIRKVETEEADYVVYKLGEDVQGYSDFAEGEILGPGDGEYVLNLETEKERFSLRPEYEGKVLEVYSPEDEDYNLVIQRTDNFSVDEVPEEDRRKIEQTLESLD